MRILLRKREVQNLLGVGPKAIDSLVAEKKLSVVYPMGKTCITSWQYFPTIEVLKLGGLNNDEDVKRIAEELR